MRSNSVSFHRGFSIEKLLKENRVSLYWNIGTYQDHQWSK
jgi:hypothetical protein